MLIPQRVKWYSLRDFLFAFRTLNGCWQDSMIQDADSVFCASWPGSMRCQVCDWVRSSAGQPIGSLSCSMRREMPLQVTRLQHDWSHARPLSLGQVGEHQRPRSSKKHSCVYYSSGVIRASRKDLKGPPGASLHSDVACCVITEIFWGHLRKNAKCLPWSVRLVCYEAIKFLIGLLCDWMA